MCPDIHDLTLGRWPSILMALGVGEGYLYNRHGPCPVCNGGKDRYRFDDKEGKGTWICSKCGSGDGFSLIMNIKGVDFKGAVKLVRGALTTALDMPPIVIKSPRSAEDTKKLLRAMWNEAQPASQTDDTGLYLHGRGLEVPTDGKALRTHPGLAYWLSDGKSGGVFPAMLAAIRDKAGAPVAIHRTWLRDGKKAPVEQPKKTLGKLSAS